VAPDSQAPTPATPDGQTSAPANLPDQPQPGAASRKAFALGWHVAELYNFESLMKGQSPRPPDPPPPALPSLGAVTQVARATVLVDQISVELPIVWARKDPPPATDDIAALVKAVPMDNAGLKWKIYDLHMQLLQSLTAQDYKTGKSFGLGRALAETVLLSDRGQPGTYADQFDFYRIQTILNWLSHLKSEFADHAALAVQSGLEVWSQWVKDHPDRPSPGAGNRAAVPANSLWTNDKESARIQALLRKQGELWRSLLSGERDPKDLLVADDYIKATEAMANRVMQLVWNFLRSPLGAVLALVSVAAVVALGVLITMGDQSKITSALVAALGSVGITVSAAGAAVQKAMVQAEKPLWDSEVGAAVVNAALISPEQTGSARVGRTLLKSIDFAAADEALLSAATTVASGTADTKT
jgi:hypothetical protein